MTPADTLARVLEALLAIPARLDAFEARLARIEEAQRPRSVPAPAGSPEDLVDTAEAARLASVQPATVTEWCRSGRLRSSKPAGSRHYRIRRGDLVAFLQGHPEDADVEAMASRIAMSRRES